MIDFTHQSILVTIHMMHSWYLDRNYTILVLPRMYSSDIHQAGVTPGIRSFRCGQGAPDQPNSLLLKEDKESAKSSWFNAHQLDILAVQAKILCWLVLGLLGVCVGMHHHRVVKEKTYFQSDACYIL